MDNDSRAEDILRHFEKPNTIYFVAKSTGVFATKVWYWVATLLINGKLKKIGENKYVKS